VSRDYFVFDLNNRNETYVIVHSLFWPYTRVHVDFVNGFYCKLT